MSKQMPKVTGAHFGGRFARLGIPQSEAEARYRAEHNPSPHDIAEFRRGYIYGQIHERVEYLEFVAHNSSRTDLYSLLANIDNLAVKWGYKPD